MNRRVILASTALVFFGFGAGAASGYLAGTARMNAMLEISGVIIKSLCAHEGYDGAIYPLDNPSEAKCARAADLAELEIMD